MLEVPATLGLELTQRMEMAQPSQHGLHRGVSVGDTRVERLEHQPLDVSAGHLDGVVLTALEHLEGRPTRVDAALQAAGQTGPDVLLAPRVHRALVLTVQQHGVVVPARLASRSRSTSWRSAVRSTTVLTA